MDAVGFHLSSLGVSDRRVAGKAAELSRLLRVRLRGPWPFAEPAKAVGCIDVACRVHRVQMDRTKAARLAGCSGEAQYRKAVQMIRSVLGVTEAVSLGELGVKFGCIKLASGAAAASLAEFRKGSRESGSAYTAAVFYLVCRRERVRCSRAEVVRMAGVTPKQFATACDAVTRVCGDLAKRVAGKAKGGQKDEEAAPAPRKQPQVRRREVVAEEEEEDDDDEEEDDDDEEEEEESEEDSEEEADSKPPSDPPANKWRPPGDVSDDDEEEVGDGNGGNDDDDDDDFDLDDELLREYSSAAKRPATAASSAQPGKRAKRR